MRIDHIKYLYDSKDKVINKLIKLFIEYFKFNSSIEWKPEFINELLNPEQIYLYLGTTKEKYQQIDHIFPRSAFNWDEIEQIKLANKPENHQYLRADVNSLKSNKLIYTKENCPLELLNLYEQIEKNGLKSYWKGGWGKKEKLRFTKSKFKNLTLPKSKQKIKNSLDTYLENHPNRTKSEELDLILKYHKIETPMQILKEISRDED